MTRRKRYTFRMQVELPFLAYPNTVKREHDKIASAIIGCVEKTTGIKSGTVRDCKTGRFRKLTMHPGQIEGDDGPFCFLHPRGCPVKKDGDESR